MTFKDWVEMTRELYRTEPPLTATKRSLRGLRNGAYRHVGRHIGSPIWAHGDWDVLVVLDACRVDQFEAVVDEYDELPDDVGTITSNASCSIDWIDRNFNNYPAKARRAGYVTANPFADHETESAPSADLSEEQLALFEPLYKTHWQDIKDGIATVPPEPITDYGIQAWRDRDTHGMDQLVLHYMQPHEPYITHPEWGSGDSKLLSNLIDSEKEAGSSVWPRVEDGEIPKAELWQAGVDNLRWVLDDVIERLLPNVDGTVVLTADHGNAMGEWGEWHHPAGAIGPAVRKVPWVEIECTDDETVVPELGEAEASTAAPEEKLEALGYL